VKKSQKQYNLPLTAKLTHAPIKVIILSSPVRRPISKKVKCSITPIPQKRVEVPFEGSLLKEVEVKFVSIPS
jgi:hypothetical protein